MDATTPIDKPLYTDTENRAALDNPDLPIEFVHDVLTARQEKSEPFIFEEQLSPKHR